MLSFVVATVASCDHVLLVVRLVVNDVLLVLLALVALTAKMLMLRAGVFSLTEIVDATLV